MSSENIPNITFDAADQWAPSSGRRNDLLSHKGLFATEVISVDVEQAKSGDHNWQFVVRHVVKDADNAGKTMFGYYPFTGVVKSGKSQGQPNIMQTYNFLFSCGWTKAQIAELKGKSIDPRQVAAKLVGKTSYVYADCDEWEGRYSSKASPLTASSGTAEDRYKQAVATNSHRDPLPEAARLQLAGGAPAPKMSNGTTSSIVRTPPPATDASSLF